MDLISAKFEAMVSWREERDVDERVGMLEGVRWVRR